jgi:hypothetical protein
MFNNRLFINGVPLDYNGQIDEKYRHYLSDKLRKNSVMAMENLDEYLLYSSLLYRSFLLLEP